MDAWWWVWASLLLVLGMALAVLEIFVPSGGILGFLAVMSVLASVVVAFFEGETAGIGFLAAAIFGLPAVIVIALKWWPQTPIGRKVLLTVPDRDEVLPDDPRRQFRSLIGRTGKAKSQMLPGGVIVIDGRTLDAVSDGVPIDAGQPIRVVDVQATTLVVRPLEEEDEKQPESPDDPLSRPIDAVGPDPFEETSA